MARILIDTDELRGLGDVYESGAGSLSNMQSQLSSMLAGTRLNETDPGIRAARIGDRQHALNGQLARIADEYRTEGREFGRLAGRVEAEESGALSAWEVITPFAWGSVAGAAGGFGLGASVVAGLVGLAVPEGILGQMRDAGLSALEATRETVARGVEVGRSALDAGLGLLTSAAHGFSQAANWLGDRIRHLVEGAWNAIWDGAAQALSAAMDGLRSLQGVIASPLGDQLKLGWDLARGLSGPIAQYVYMGTCGLVLMKAGKYLHDGQMMMSGRGLYGAANRWVAVKGASRALWVLGPALDFTEALFGARQNGWDSPDFIVPAARGALTIAAAGAAAAVGALAVTGTSLAGATAGLGAGAFALGWAIGDGLNWVAEKTTGASISDRWLNSTHNEHLRIQIDKKNAGAERS